MRQKPAYLPLYVRDFISDTCVLSLTWIEQGIHLRMLMVSWEQGPLLDDPDTVGRQIAWDASLGEIGPKVRKVWETCWRRSGQGWESPRLERERLWAAECIAKASKKGRKGAHSRWKKRAMPEQCPSNAQAMLTQAQAQAQVQDQSTDGSSLRSEPPAPRRRGRRKGQVLTMPVENANTTPEASKRPVTPQAELLEFWASEWQRTRGAAWASRKQDYILAAKVLALEGSSLPEAKARATRLLENGQDAWLAQNASVELLLRRWNNLAFEVKNGRHAEGAGERLARELREAGIEVTR